MHGKLYRVAKTVGNHRGDVSDGIFGGSGLQPQYDAAVNAIGLTCFIFRFLRRPQFTRTPSAPKRPCPAPMPACRMRFDPVAHPILTRLSARSSVRLPRVAVIRRSTSRAVRCLRSFIVLSNVRRKNAAQSRAVAGGGGWTLDKMVHFV